MVKVITILIIAAIATAILLGALALIKRQKLKAKARQCAIEAQRFHEKLQQLSDPSHLFTDEELRQLKKEFTPLLDDVLLLYNHPLVSKDYIIELGLRDFIDERKILNHIQLKNNQAYHQTHSPAQQ